MVAASVRSSRKLLESADTTEIAETGRGCYLGDGESEEESKVGPPKDSAGRSHRGREAEPRRRLSLAALPPLRVSGRRLVLERDSGGGGGDSDDMVLRGEEGAEQEQDEVSAVGEVTARGQQRRGRSVDRSTTGSWKSPLRSLDEKDVSSTAM